MLYNRETVHYKKLQDGESAKEVFKGIHNYVVEKSMT